ncbi:MAG: diacylglycerol kinase [Proteobacteria bacterium]|nr:diacylglycerol kinase [Pseudomonadota bacterium]
MLRLYHAARYSLMGLASAWRTEAAFRQEVVLFMVLAPLGCWLGESGIERALLVGPLLLVLIVELLNSGLEAAIDRIGPEIHPLSKQAKDVASAAVFVSLITAAAIWALVLI